MRKLLFILITLVALAGCDGGGGGSGFAALGGGGGGGNGGETPTGVVTVIPEPATVAILGLGLAGLATGLLIRKKKK
ncbi:MAG: PEP-CTERM sorting domain-containing protein [Candidatus Omnitrophota bacterium]